MICVFVIDYSVSYLDLDIGMHITRNHVDKPLSNTAQFYLGGLVLLQIAKPGC